MDIREAILESAETRMRASGFHGCSFRDIAGDVGIKSASIYYHFPTKALLGGAMVARYQARVLAAIGDAEDSRDLAAKLDGMSAAFRAGIARGDGMCLCGVLASETRSLPVELVSATRLFFETCNNWLAAAFASARASDPRREARRVTALLQGAMLQAVALDDISAFDDAVDGLQPRSA